MLLAALLLAAPGAAPATVPRPAASGVVGDCTEGVSGQPVPRFVSLKGGSAMLRSGPDDRRFPIRWEYRRRGLPMEVLREYCIWRQVRDPDGTVGWMNKSLLTGVRTGYVTSGIRTLYTAPDLQSRVAWRIEPGTIVTITLCESVWCRVSNGGRSGYLLRAQMWGTYQNEAIGG